MRGVGLRSVQQVALVGAVVDEVHVAAVGLEGESEECASAGRGAAGVERANRHLSPARCGLNHPNSNSGTPQVLGRRSADRYLLGDNGIDMHGVIVTC